ncbi:hypothetical protein KC19_6G184200 [Ceratodon purpureus]|uniref:Uncharacterized protein n=1 Tax=Ceratodon purpureus TaxID=3225 RepID=A0A8T0HIQ8_CERPU|nr:hypothetical protein KC19_6G184200 [Ceratodon purpureus]
MQSSVYRYYFALSAPIHFPPSSLQITDLSLTLLNPQPPQYSDEKTAIVTCYSNTAPYFNALGRENRRLDNAATQNSLASYISKRLQKAPESALTVIKGSQTPNLKAPQQKACLSPSKNTKHA